LPGLNGFGLWTYHFIYDPSPVVATVAPLAAWNGTFFTNGNGATTAGHVVTLVVNFNENVFVDLDAGTPTLSLNDGGTATYVGGSGKNALMFNYLVQAGQSTPDLTVTSFNLPTTSQTFKLLDINDGLIAFPNPIVHDAAGNAADLSGAVTNPAGTLEIGIVPPTVVADQTHVTIGASVTADPTHGVLANDTDHVPNDALTVSAVLGSANCPDRDSPEVVHVAFNIILEVPIGDRTQKWHFGIHYLNARLF
jgi:hypothetical protein